MGSEYTDMFKTYKRIVESFNLLDNEKEGKINHDLRTLVTRLLGFDFTKLAFIRSGEHEFYVEKDIEINKDHPYLVKIKLTYQLDYDKDSIKAYVFDAYGLTYGDSGYDEKFKEVRSERYPGHQFDGDSFWNCYHEYMLDLSSPCNSCKHSEQDFMCNVDESCSIIDDKDDIDDPESTNLWRLRLKLRTPEGMEVRVVSMPVSARPYELLERSFSVQAVLNQNANHWVVSCKHSQTESELVITSKSKEEGFSRLEQVLRLLYLPKGE